jgi:hypothetical protein
VAGPTEQRPAAPGRIMATRSSRVTSLVTAGALGAACTYLAFVDPNESSAYPQCPLRLVTGVDCALCGGLRATSALLGGDVARAARQNLLVVLLAPLAAWAMLQWFASQWGWCIPGPPVRRWMAPALLAVALVFTVVRNLDWGPGPWLHSDTF